MRLNDLLKVRRSPVTNGKNIWMYLSFCPARIQFIFLPCPDTVQYELRGIKSCVMMFLKWIILTE